MRPLTLRAWPLLVVIGITWPMSAISPPRAEIQTYRLPKPAATPPVIDGILADAAWENALRITSFRLLAAVPGDEPDLPETVALVTHDADALYVAFHCSEPSMPDLVTTIGEHDGNTWMDDSVEIFLNPSGDRRRYVQLAINADGVIMDGYKESPQAPLDLSWETGARVGVSRDESGWRLESRIPFSGLPLAAPDAVWTFHLARNRRAAGQHITSLRSVVSGFHDVHAFDGLAGIRLPHRDVAVLSIAPGNAYRGTNVARIRLRNYGDTARKITASLTVVNDDLNKAPVTATIQVRPGEETDCALPWVVDSTLTTASFQVLIEVRSDKHLLRRAVAAVESVPPVIGPLNRGAHIMEAHAPVMLRVPIRVGSGSRSSLTLHWQAFDGAGALVGRGMTTVRTEDALIRLFWNGWYDGRYRLQLTAKHDGSTLATADRRIRLVRSPWGG